MMTCKTVAVTLRTMCGRSAVIFAPETMRLREVIQNNAQLQLESGFRVVAAGTVVFDSVEDPDTFSMCNLNDRVLQVTGKTTEKLACLHVIPSAGPAFA